MFPVLSSEEKSDGPGEMAFLRAVGVKSFQATSRGSVLFIEGGVKFLNHSHVFLVARAMVFSIYMVYICTIHGSFVLEGSIQSQAEKSINVNNSIECC